MVFRLFKMSEKIPWYRVVHRGPKLQGMWQLAVGGSMLFGLVIVPLAVRIRANSLQREQLLGSYPGAKDSEVLMALVHQERVKMRTALLGECKK